MKRGVIQDFYRVLCLKSLKLCFNWLGKEISLSWSYFYFLPSKDSRRCLTWRITGDMKGIKMFHSKIKVIGPRGNRLGRRAQK